MKLTVEIDLDNAAFDEDVFEEMARILSEVVDEMAWKRACDPKITLRDANGNKVGFARIDL